MIVIARGILGRPWKGFVKLFQKTSPSWKPKLVKRMNAFASLMGCKLREWLSAAPHTPVQLTAFSDGSAVCTVSQLKLWVGLTRVGSLWRERPIFLQRKGKCVCFILKLPASVIKEGYGCMEQWHHSGGDRCNSHSVLHCVWHAAPSLSIRINTRLKFVAGREFLSLECFMSYP